MIGSGAAIAGVHRPDRRASADVRPGATRDVLLARAAQDHPDADRRSTAADSAVLRRGGPARAVRRRRPGGAHATSTSRKVRAGLLDVTGRLFGLDVRRGRGRPAWHEDVASTTCYRDGELLGRIYLDMHPREGKYKHAAQFDLVRGRRRPAAARGRARLQLPARADGARRRGDALPRVRPPACTTSSAAGSEWVAVLRRGHRVGLRRGAVADARGVGLGRRRAADLRHQRGRRADPGRAGATDAGGQRVRQGRSRPAPRCSTRRSSYRLHQRPARRPDRARSASCSSAYDLFAAARHPLPRRLRPPGRLHLGVLHLHVVPGHREGPVLGVRPRRPVRPEVASRYRDRVLAPGGPGTPPTWSRTSSAGPTASTAFEEWLSS